MAWGGDNPVRHFNPVGSNPGLTNGFDQLESKKSASLDMVLIFGESNAHGPFKHSHNSTYWVLEVPLSGSNNYEHSHASVNMPHVSILATTGLQQTWAFSALVILIVHIIRKFLFKISSWLYRSNTSSNLKEIRYLFWARNYFNWPILWMCPHPIVWNPRFCCFKEKTTNIVRPKQQKQESHTHLTPKLTILSPPATTGLGVIEMQQGQEVWPRQAGRCLASNARDFVWTYQNGLEGKTIEHQLGVGLGFLLLSFHYG